MFGRGNYTNVRLLGGLGNQMFQYCAGRALAARTGTRLRLDATMIAIEAHRRYALDELRIDARVVRRPARSVEELEDREIDDRYIAKRFRATRIDEIDELFRDELADAPPNSYLTGYWQSERYFEAVADEIRAEFQLRRWGPAAISAANRIATATNSVAVHVRRGDYAFLEQTRRNFGLMPQEYYTAAANLIGEQSGECSYFVFSDEPEWCRENLALPGRMEIVSGDTSDAEDIHLIACCDHAIIANSSYSWWGAWLGETESTIVVAPIKWTDELVHDSRDKVPDRWHRL